GACRGANRCQTANFGKPRRNSLSDTGLPHGMLRLRLCRITVLSLAGMAAAQAANNGCPDRPVRSISSPAMPADVCIPDGFTDVPVNYFDDYSWRAFLAMVWPAAPGHRGAADAG